MMYKRIAKLLAEKATPQENRREVIDNDNTERSNIATTAPGQKKSPFWMNRMKGTVRNAVSARNRLKGRKTRQPDAATATAEHGSKTITVSPKRGPNL